MRTQTIVHRPTGAAATAALLKRAAEDGRRITFRGAGRSYGDAAISSSADILDLSAMRRVRSFDLDAGIVEVEAGVTIEDLWRTFLPHGLWPAVVPGTMRPTVGGCVSMNIHGKNHWRAGGFGEHVEEIEVARPSGELVRVRADAESDLDVGTFRAITGGMGLLGAVTAARLRLKRVHSGNLEVTARATESLDEMVAEFERRAPDADYLVGWIDCFDEAARGVLHAARHLAPGEDPLPARSLHASEQELPPRIAGVVPRGLTALAMKPFARPAGVRLVNRVRSALSRFRGEHRFLESHVRFAFLLDFVPGWKRIYEPGGLIQHQSFIPKASALAAHREILAHCRRSGMPPWLGVFKKHRDCPSLLPHAVDGYSLALDFPVTTENRERLWAMCRELDEVVLAAGGRFYFAKDLTATPETLRRAYPAWPQFAAMRAAADPRGVLTNDLVRRLGAET